MAAELEGQRRRRNRRAFYVLTILTLATVALVAVARLGSVDPAKDGPATPAATSEPPSEPLVFRESTALVIPDTVRSPSHRFEASAGDVYLLRFEATAKKPNDSPGDAMYFGASLACAGNEDVASQSIGGTQNVRSGETVAIRNQFLLEVDEPGEYSCRLSVSSPNEEAAAKGAIVEVQTEWSMRPVEGVAVDAPSEEKLPRVVEPGQREEIFRVEIEPGDEPMDVFSTVHATTCTMVNGSSEDGREWCRGTQIDTRGSAVEVNYSRFVLDDAEKVCDSQIVATTRDAIGWSTHHSILAAEFRERETPNECGAKFRYVVTVENSGPASVVIHRTHSTLLVVAG